MTLELEPPIIMVGDGQVELYADVARAADSVEAVDAQLYKAYDRKGRPVRVTGEFQEGESWLGLSWVQNGDVTIEPASGQPTHAAELREALMDWWSRTGGVVRTAVAPAELEWTLDQLVDAIAKRDGVR